MVESADEPPLRGLHSWAKIKELSHINPFRKSQKQPAIPTDTLPTHNVGHTDDSQSAVPVTEIAVAGPSKTEPQPASVVDKKGNGEESTAIDASAGQPKAPIHHRFVRDVKRIVTASWINWLLVFVPVAIILGAVSDWGGHHVVNPNIIFALNAIAIIPLASLLAFATESVALRMGDAVGALMNVTFGNAVEIIIFVLALVAGEVRVVQAAALGSILSNLLLILGMCFVLGGLKFREQVYNPTVSQMSACLLSLSVVSLLLPTAFHAAFEDKDTADRVVLKVSRGTSVVLLLVYILYLLFQLKSHAFMYESTPQHIIDEESHPGVLADILHSSSSSSDDSSSSSSDSDATSSSHKTSTRIKRALRRKRRKMSSSTKETVGPISRAETDVTLMTTSSQLTHDGLFSGDEADGEGQRQARSAQPSPIVSRDFETEAEDEKQHRKRGKKPRKSKQHSTESLNEKAALTKAESSASETQKTPRAEVGFASEIQEIPNDAAARRPFHLRGLSNAVKPAFNSTVFPHHEATGRSLAIPLSALRPTERVPGDGAKRASSLPDIRRQSGPFRAASPRPHLPAYDAPAEAQAVEVIDPHQHLSRTSAVVLLLCTTGLVALCAEFLVGSIDYMVSTSGVSQAFIGLIILPIVGNAAEHVTAVTVAYKNKMDLAINIALGSSIQIALFVTPLMVMLGWAIGSDMSLYFSLFETMSLFASAFIVNYLMIDGRSNYLEGTLLIAAYVIIAIAAFFYPQCGLSAAGGPMDNHRAC